MSNSESTVNVKAVCFNTLSNVYSPGCGAFCGLVYIRNGRGSAPPSWSSTLSLPPPITSLGEALVTDSLIFSNKLNNCCCWSSSSVFPGSFKKSFIVKNLLTFSFTVASKELIVLIFSLLIFKKSPISLNFAVKLFEVSVSIGTDGTSAGGVVLPGGIIGATAGGATCFGWVARL